MIHSGYYLLLLLIHWPILIAIDGPHLTMVGIITILTIILSMINYY